MNKREWKKLLATLKVDTRLGEISPVAPEVLDDFERQRKLRLPRGYRTYCEVFEAGELSEQFKIAVPGYKGPGKPYALEYLEKMAHTGLDHEEYSPNPEQHDRSLFFCIDILGSYHFFDPAEVTDTRRNEYAVYTLYSDFSVKRMAENFWLFVTECCLGKKHRLLIREPPPLRLFLPVGS
jgi:hypothetical protein